MRRSGSRIVDAGIYKKIVLERRPADRARSGWGQDAASKPWSRPSSKSATSRPWKNDLLDETSISPYYEKSRSSSSLVFGFLAAALPGRAASGRLFFARFPQARRMSSAPGVQLRNPAAGCHRLRAIRRPQFGYVLEMRTGVGMDKPEIEQAWAGLDLFRRLPGPAGALPRPLRADERGRPRLPDACSWTLPIPWRGLSGQLARARRDGRGPDRRLPLRGLHRQRAGRGRCDRPTASSSGTTTGTRPGAAGSASPSAQELEVGGSYYHGRQDAADARNLMIYGADAAWTTENVRCPAEYARADIDNPAPFAAGGPRAGSSSSA